MSKFDDVALPDDEGSALERILAKVVQKCHEAQIKTRELGVMFRNLRVVGLDASTSYQPTFSSVFNPLKILGWIQNSRHPPVRDIIKGLEGVVRPGEMLLVLGRPGSGCTTLLKTLANSHEEYNKVEGELFYDSISPQDLKDRFRGDVQYCSEEDVHFSTLNVDETLDFAAKSRTPNKRFGHTRAEYRKAITDVLITVFGLNHARKTRVGDAVIRGISGGEKKRVSIAEVLATRSCVTAWDNSTRGLDASTALEFVSALRIATNTFNLTSILSLYQAGESLYKQFDKVCVLYEGRMAYFGPADQTKKYFMDMGYEPANRQTTADFLVSVTNPMARIPRPGVASIPRTAAEFAAYFNQSELGGANKADIDSYHAKFVGKPERVVAYTKSAQEEHAKGFRKTSPYMISILMQVRAVMRRRLQILKGNLLLTCLSIVFYVFQALIVGSIFLMMPETTSAFYSRGGVIFFALLAAALSTMAEIPALYEQRPIVLKHKKAALYHPFVEALASTLVDVPITLATFVVFGIIIYFMAGLQRSASQFFIFLLFLCTLAIAVKAYFRGLAAACKSPATAQGIAGLSIFVMALYTGYTIPQPTMIGALRWITYINPFRYGFEALMSNEFRTIKGVCSNLVPQGPGYENVPLANQVCTTVGALPGETIVDGARFAQLSFGYSFSNTWMNFGIIIAFGVAFFFGLLFFTEFMASTRTETAVILFRQGSKPMALKPFGSSDEEAVKHGDRNTFQVAENFKPETDHSARKDIFSWQHIDYTVPISHSQELQLLADVSGYVTPGKLTALMGESGAGKTTLLNVLAQRVTTGVVTGDMFVNGQAIPRDFRSQTGYCQQLDVHLPSATVREALLFSAKLRQPPSVPIAEKEAYVEECLRMCDLEAYAEASVGSVTVELQKRVTIAIELAAKPKLLLFLDEPTSGLDSQSAWSIVSFLKSLANLGQAVLCTIHQPSAELFQAFDKLLLLRKGGETVYFGDLGHKAATLIDYFERNGSRTCQADENPAEFMLEIIGAGAAASSERNWHEVWHASQQAVQLQQELDTIHQEGRTRPPVQATYGSEVSTSWFYQVVQLLKRDTDAHWRDPTYLLAKLVLNAIAGLFIGFTFFHSKDSQQGTQNKLFAIFMATILSVPLTNQLQVPYLAMRSIYEIRERPSRTYTWTALLTSQILAELPWNMLGFTIFFLCWYWTVGFESSRAGYTYLLLAIVFPMYFTTAGQAVASMAPTAEVGGLIFAFLFSFVVLCNGVLQPYHALGWWQWMNRVSPHTYIIESLFGQAVGRQPITCSPVEFVTITPPSGQSCGQYMGPYMSSAGGYLTNPDATSSCHFCSVRTTDELIQRSFQMSYDHHWRNLGLIMAFTFFNIFCIFSLTYIFRIRTKSLLSSLRRRRTT